MKKKTRGMIEVMMMMMIMRKKTFSKKEEDRDIEQVK